MHRFCFALITLFLAVGRPAAAQTALKTPDEFLPHRLGEQFTPHHMLNSYFEYLAANAPSTMRLERYGATYESRPLQLAFFSSPENLARLEQIRLNNLRLAGAAPDAAAKGGSTEPAVAVVWLSMSVHGNEPSGSECSMLLAHQLAGQSEAQVREWLRNTLVILDPSLNPDGYDRYTHWNRSASNRWVTPQLDAREHREPWPGGRTNHYYFDLNRDWAWATQIETRQRLQVYHRWLPHVHADLHEQYLDNPYYFAPAAEPMHDYISPWQRSFQTEIGQNHARYFDTEGWLYFTKEVFDLFYPSYGDTYPMFNGAIGMTYEQAGHSMAGRAAITGMGDTLTLRDRIDHHLATSRSTIEMASRNAARLVENFSAYFSRTAAQPQGHYKTFVIPETNRTGQVNALCRLLDLHQIRYGRAGAAYSGRKGFDYVGGKEGSFSIGANDLVISAYQPKSVLVQVLFEPEPRLSDSLTYDITAWALPFAYGLPAYALPERIEPKKPFEPYRAAEVKIAASPYSWCAQRNSLDGAVFVSSLLRQGVKVRTAQRAFQVADQQFEPGAFIINRADNRDIEGRLDGLVKAAAAEANVAVHPIFSGYSGKGSDLGSDAFLPVTRPTVALVYGDEVDDNSYGHTWYFFERELGYPVAPIPLARLGAVRLADYNTLVFPHGSYSLSDATAKIIQDWVRQGGRLIAFEGGVKAFADRDGFDLKKKSDAKKDTAAGEPRPYQSRERDRISDQLPGAVIKTRVDNTHPLAFGLSDHYFSLKTSSDVFELPAGTSPAIWIDDDYRSYGFIGSRLKPRLKKTPVAAVQTLGSGKVIYLVDNPLFRAFWEEGKLVFANALFY
jgi:hypothetical protein